MTLFNNTESILSIKEPCSYKNGVILPNNGVILPHSERILFMGDIDKKIAKTKNELNYLTYAQAQRSTHGGKSSEQKESHNKIKFNLALKDYHYWFQQKISS